MVFCRALFIIAGVVAGSLIELRRPGEAINPAQFERALRELEKRLTEQQNRSEQRLASMEARVEQHETRLNDVPSTTQIVGAMEELLSRTMAGLDSRLTSQARSIEILKTTVSQTDELLERVLESLDSLRPHPAEEKGNERPLPPGGEQQA